MTTMPAEAEASAEAMFHKLFRLFGRRDRHTAEEIEEEAMRALEAADQASERESDGLSPFEAAFDCAQDVRFLP